MRCQLYEVTDNQLMRWETSQMNCISVAQSQVGPLYDLYTFVVGRVIEQNR